MLVPWVALTALAPVTTAATGSERAGRGASAEIITVSPGSTYVVRVAGKGRVALHGAATAVASEGRSVRFRAGARRLVVDRIGRIRDVDVVRAAPDEEGGIRPRCSNPPRPALRPGAGRAEVVVIGGHAAGVGAAIAAARRCRSVLLVAAEAVPGGMLTAGQIGFMDGTPLFSWNEVHADSFGVNGEIAAQSGWSTSGGLLRDFRREISFGEGHGRLDLEETLRYEPHVGRAAIERMLRLPNLRVITGTRPVASAMNGRRVAYVDVAGSVNARLQGEVWVDGSDTGGLVGQLRLPYELGTPAADAPSGDGSVMAYAYRWTAVEGESGVVPHEPPPYYAINRSVYRAATGERWPRYREAFNVPSDAAYEVHPWRLLNPQGRLTGAFEEPVGDPATGARLLGAAPQKWDVNGGMNNATGQEIAQMLASREDVAALFEAAGIRNPYRSPVLDPRWANVAWIQDAAPLSLADRQFLDERVREAVRARAQGLLWYVRSGDLQARLRQLPGGRRAVVRASWSVSNELGTPDGMPMLMYEREGRRIVPEHRMTIYDLCATYDRDHVLPEPVCTATPRYYRSGVVVADYNVDVAQTNATRPVHFPLPRPRQLPLPTLIPRGTHGLLVGGAIGVDRLSYASFRLDPVRLLTGGAIGTAAALALERGDTAFQRLDPIALRWALADDFHPTFFVQDAPVWDQAGKRWRDVEVGVALQKLVAQGWVPRAWDASPYSGPAMLAPQQAVTPRALVALWRPLGRARCAPPRPRGASAEGGLSLASLTGLPAAAGPATVGDVYVHLAAHLREPGTASCPADR